MHQKYKDNLEQVSKPTGLNSVGFSAFCVSLPAISFISSISNPNKQSQPPHLLSFVPVRVSDWSSIAEADFISKQGPETGFLLVIKQKKRER